MALWDALGHHERAAVCFLANCRQRGRNGAVGWTARYHLARAHQHGVARAAVGNDDRWKGAPSRGVERPSRDRAAAHPWLFRLGFSTDQVRTHIHRNIGLNVLLALGLALLLWGLSFAFMRRILIPLRSLTGATTELERGNLDVSLPEAKVSSWPSSCGRFA